MVFDSRNSKMTSKLPLNLLVLSYRKILSKFIMRDISVKKKDVAQKLSNFFFKWHSFKYHKLDLVKNQAHFFSWFTYNLQLKPDNFSELILLNYCCLII